MASSDITNRIAAVAEHPLNTETVKLAGKSADLSTTLCSLQEKCGHEATSTDISNIATELALLSQALWRLHEALAADPNQYTESFDQDLSEITTELHMIFEEITDCCDELQQADREKAGKVAWMFRKGKVHKLQKHLEALKQTIQVMRTVLWHGKDYGTHNSPGRLAESSPHTMHEDRVILESVLAKNRNAIIDLHMLDPPDQKHSSSLSSEAMANAGAHHRKFSESTGVECPPLPDVLPPVKGPQEAIPSKTISPSRRFSKRGVRLAVHSSILDMDAHNAPTQLKQKWIQKSRENHHQCLVSLAKISEVDSTQSNNKLNQAASQIEPEPLRGVAVDTNSRKPWECTFQSKLVEYPVDEDAGKKVDQAFPKRGPSLKIVTTPLRKMINKLSISHESIQDENKDNSRLTVRNLQTPALKTPDFDEEFENGV